MNNRVADIGKTTDLVIRGDYNTGKMPLQRVERP